MISLADLQTVNLRKTKGKSLTARRKSFHCSKEYDWVLDCAVNSPSFSSFNQSPPEFCRMKLKRLNHIRSPGGTIIRNQNPEQEFGEGPTPMLTRALRRKFLVSENPDKWLLLICTLYFRLPVPYLHLGLHLPVQWLPGPLPTILWHLSPHRHCWLP